MGEITISVDEYKGLLEMLVRVKLFSIYVNSKTYIDREECGRYLGFEVNDVRAD